MSRALMAWMVLGLMSSTAFAGGGTLTGKLDLPPGPERPPPQVKGFLDRVENSLAPVAKLSLARDMVVVALGEEKPVSPPQVVIELQGESFNHRVVAAPAGSEVVIKNVSKTARTLVAEEDPKLIPEGPINPTGPKSFRVTETDKVYHIGDKAAPHLKLTIIVVNTPYVGYPDDGGKFDIPAMSPGNYKLKVWYGDKWVDRPDESVDVKEKGKNEVNLKIDAAAVSAAGKK